MTKTSLKNLKKYGRYALSLDDEKRSKSDYRIYLIAECLVRAEVICGNNTEGVRKLQGLSSK